MNMKTQCSKGRKQSNFIEGAILKADHVNNALPEYAFTGLENAWCSTRSFHN